MEKNGTWLYGIEWHLWKNMEFMKEDGIMKKNVVLWNRNALFMGEIGSAIWHLWKKRALFMEKQTPAPVNEQEIFFL